MSFATVAHTIENEVSAVNGGASYFIEVMRESGGILIIVFINYNFILLIIFTQIMDNILNGEGCA